MDQMAPAPDAWQKTASPILTKDGLMQSMDRLSSWFPELLGNSGYLEYLHVLAGIVFTLRPRKSVGLGINQRVAYFALCQAAPEAELDAEVLGIDVRPSEAGSADNTDAPQVPEAILRHNQRTYATLSRLMCCDAAASFDLGEIDVLLGHQDLSANLPDSLQRHWLPQMSDQGVIALRGNLGGASRCPEPRGNLRSIAVFDKVLAASGVARGHWLFAATRQDAARAFVAVARPAGRVIRRRWAWNRAFWYGVADA